MKDFKHCNQGGSKKREEDLLRIVQQLMTSSSEDGTHVKFNRVNLEGSNVGAVMHAPHGDPAERQLDRGSVNIYISNNIQGVNNSILLGSEVKMAEPGLGLSFGDIVWERGTLERTETNANANANPSKFPLTFWFNAALVCALVLASSILVALFGPRRLDG